MNHWDKDFFIFVEIHTYDTNDTSSSSLVTKQCSWHNMETNENNRLLLRKAFRLSKNNKGIPRNKNNCVDDTKEIDTGDIIISSLN